MVAEIPSPAAQQAKIATRKAHGKARYANADPKRPTDRIENAFIDCVLLGWPYHRCYTAATGAQVKKTSAEVAAWRIMQRPAVQRELAERRAAMDETRALTRNEKRSVLANIAREPSVPALARIGAIQVDNRMTGDDEPKKGAPGGGSALVFSVDPMRDVRRAESIPLGDTPPKLTE